MDRKHLNEPFAVRVSTDEVAIRRSRPADAAAVQVFVRGLTPLSRRRRFFGPVVELSPDQLDRVIRVRDPRELALLAVAAADGAVVAMAQYALAGTDEAEFALVVADAWQRRGLGESLLARLAAHAAGAGVRALVGDVLADNWPMLALLAAHGFELDADCEPQIVRARKPIVAPACSATAARLAGLWASALRRGDGVRAPNASWGLQ